MNVRERTEEIERLTLAPWATFSDESRGRQRQEEPDDIRPVFQRGQGPRHPLQGVSPPQTEDTGLPLAGGRPLPHPPDPHAGSLPDRPHHRPGPAAQRGPDRSHQPRPRPWAHSLRPRGRKLRWTSSARTASSTICRACGWWTSSRKKEGQGLNLTWEVRNGIITHTKGTWAATPEGRIVRMADQIAFVNHDIEDAVRAGVLDPATLPKDCTHGGAGRDEIPAHHDHDQQHPCPQRRRRWRGSRGGTKKRFWP